MAKKTFSNCWHDYELIDAGGDKKLERWGEIITIRPEVQAYFRPGLSEKEWNAKAHLEFVPKGNTSGNWIQLNELPSEDWIVNYKGLKFSLEQTKFKHLGLFPEQATNWDLITNHLKPGSKMLNLFAYTGAASIVGRATGAEVTHVDSVRQLITWARNNMELSGLSDIRWIHDDALKFAQKEVNRGNSYDLIIMDPPAWGIGAKKERWQLENQLENLIETASKLLNENGLLILNTYSPRVTLEDIYTYSELCFKSLDLTELWKKTTTGKNLFYGFLLRAYK